MSICDNSRLQNSKLEPAVSNISFERPWHKDPSNVAPLTAELQKLPLAENQLKYMTEQLEAKGVFCANNLQGFSPWEYLIEMDNYEAIDIALKRKFFDVNDLTAPPYCHYAGALRTTLMRKRNVSFNMVRTLFKCGANPNDYITSELFDHRIDKYPLIHFAIAHENIGLVDLMVDHGASTDTKNNYRSLLVMASSTGSSEMVWHLIHNHNQDVNEVVTMRLHEFESDAFSADVTALTIAAINGHIEVAKLLLDEGADATFIDNTGRSILSYVVVMTEDHEVRHKMLMLLMEHRAKFTEADRKPFPKSISDYEWDRKMSQLTLTDKGLERYYPDPLSEFEITNDSEEVPF